MTSFGVRPYRADDRPEVLGLLAQVWGTSTEGLAIVHRHELQWDWRFARNPYADPDLPTGLVLENDDAIVGFISCMPTRVNLHGGVVGAFWSGEWVTAPQRGRGFGHLLQRRLMTLPALGLATPNPIAYPALRRLGWSDVYRLENRIRVVRPDRLLAATNGARVLGRAAGWVLGAASSAAAAARRAGADAGVAVVPTRRFDERFDDFWRRVAPGYPAAVVRDSRFLAWRYLEIPDREYAIAAAERGGEVAGYVVFYVRHRRGLVFGHVIDLLVAKGDAGARDALLAHAVEELERRGVDLVNCYLSPYDAFLRAGLRRCGFFFAKQSGAVVARDGARPPGAAAAVEPREWFVSRGDSDLDMAT